MLKALCLVDGTQVEVEALVRRAATFTSINWHVT
jgi:hypothetical protein